MELVTSNGSQLAYTCVQQEVESLESFLNAEGPHWVSILGTSLRRNAVKAEQSSFVPRLVGNLIAIKLLIGDK